MKIEGFINLKMIMVIHGIMIIFEMSLFKIYTKIFTGKSYNS